MTEKQLRQMKNKYYGIDFSRCKYSLEELLDDVNEHIVDVNLNKEYRYRALHSELNKLRKKRKNNLRYDPSLEQEMFRIELRMTDLKSRAEASIYDLKQYREEIKRQIAEKNRLRDIALGIEYD